MHELDYSTIPCWSILHACIMRHCYDMLYSVIDNYGKLSTVIY
jgi:hypothetical protein